MVRTARAVGYATGMCTECGHLTDLADRRVVVHDRIVHVPTGPDLG